MSRGWFGRRENATASTTAAGPDGRAGLDGRTAGLDGRAAGLDGRAAGPDGRAAGPDGRAAGPDVAEAPSVPVPVLTIDALGRKCPIPIIMLAEQIRDVPVGEIVAVLADDPAAYTDVPAWCGMKSHEFVISRELPSGWAFLIRRRY